MPDSGSGTWFGQESLGKGCQVNDADLRLALLAIEPRGRELLRRYLIADQSDRDALALRLLHEGTEHAQRLADLIDTLTMHPDERRRVVRLLGELEAF
jgi:hypothetical protein